jgi:hypothetical protein
VTDLPPAIIDRRRRVEDTRRWRERLRRGSIVLPIEVDGPLYDLMEHFGALRAVPTMR